MKTALIGHRKIFAKDICQRLTTAISTEIDNGCKTFTMGTHGEFDINTLYVCKQLRNTYPDIQIEVVLTSLPMVKKRDAEHSPYDDVQTVMYDIENAHYKQRITVSNRQMIDTCDTLICYVDTSTSISGAKTALRHAEKQGLKIINLYRDEDNPFYGMTKEQVQAYWQTLSESVNKRK